MTYNGTVFSVSIIILLTAMSPGPDFAIIVQNSLVYSRRSGYFTSLGIGAAILVHMSYCVFGLASVISSSGLLFSIIKYIGASYLIYLGIESLFSKPAQTTFLPNGTITPRKISNFVSFRQGFLCNLLNPKATLFFLSLFTALIKLRISAGLMSIYALMVFFITVAWFCTLTTVLSHSYVKLILKKAEKYITKLLGILLIGFGVILIFVSA